MLFPLWGRHFEIQEWLPENKGSNYSKFIAAAGGVVGGFR